MATAARWSWLAILGGLLGGVVGMQSAWACVPQPRLVAVLPDSSGPPGTEVTIDGLGFDRGRAEVRWNSRDGELLASADGPDFSATITIPEVPAGLYALIVLSRQPGGAIGNTARAAFEVTGPLATGDTTPTAPPTTAVASAPSSPGPGLNPWSGAGLVAAGAVAGATGATGLHAVRRRRSTRSA